LRLAGSVHGHYLSVERDSWSGFTSSSSSLPGTCLPLPPCRRNLPVKYRPVISAVIGGDMDYDALHRWFNATFLIAACASTVGWVAGKVPRMQK